MFFNGALMIIISSNCVIAEMIRLKLRHNFVHVKNQQAQLFDSAFTFQIRLDSRYLGLAIFLTANILTGLINIYALNMLKIESSRLEFIFLSCVIQCLAILIPIYILKKILVRDNFIVKSPTLL